ncbi:hypothetical protein ACEWY4_023716 [Coilia grayii]|uniref:SRCR domain-containing protein n=1 Tax=Coilia grayii TaxID=363190 RepID=A0ABD1J1Z6_9TELE
MNINVKYMHFLSLMPIPARVRVTLLKDTCTWTLQNDTGSKVVLTQELRLRMVEQVCQSLDCGGVDHIIEKVAPPNSTCLSQCRQVDHTALGNCSTVVSSNCKVLSNVYCEHNKARLVGGGHRCGGRVELWHNQQWGTVCDDNWDLSDANVVCAQLGCGFAVMVTGQNGRFGPGSGSILLDELNCTGHEGNLWECPAQRGTDDCGHKEDAGVICSEFKDVRLTGGLDRCSGRVEIHRNGTWGTVCEDCFEKDEAAIVCSMLNCGKAVQFTAFSPPFPPFAHGNGTKWFYTCRSSQPPPLWDCKEFANDRIRCQGSKAAGLICECKCSAVYNVIYCRMQVISAFGVSPSMSTAFVSVTTSRPPLQLSPLLLASVGLSAALLIALVSNIIICWRHRRQDELVIHQKSRQLQSAGERHQNDYRDSINLVNIASSNYEADNTDQAAELSPRMPQYYPQSSMDSTLSGDTDMDSSLSMELTYPLSTFRNSRKYGSVRKPPHAAVSHMSSLTEEACNPVEDPAKVHAGNCSSSLVPNHEPIRTSYAGTASVDSFDTSSTSSGECYENTGPSTADLPDSEEPVYDQTDDHFLSQRGNHAGNHRDLLPEDLTCGQEDSPIYSPVSMEPPDEEQDSDCDYDDVANYMQ